MPGDNPPTVPINVSVNSTSDVILLTLYCTSYRVMIPLAVAGDCHDNVTDVDWRVSTDSECGSDGSIIDSFVN